MLAIKLFLILTGAVLYLGGVGYWFFGVVPDLFYWHTTSGLVQVAGGTCGLIIGTGCIIIHVIRKAPVRAAEK